MKEEFYNTYKNLGKAAIILQGYASTIMSDEELDFFYTGMAIDRTPFFLSKRGLYIVEPAILLDDFRHEFVAGNEIIVQAEGERLKILRGKELLLQMEAKNAQSAEALRQDLEYFKEG
ncbi:MAG: hypothetical protein LBD38_04475 [Streptococcaceae bacterium]|jgi:hypothetical protein|nr:hypothetical protein [Streptococcaceae bacterium]